jgi:hypothetical protein
MAALILAVGLSGAAQAALLDRGGGLIYDDDLNVTWLQQPYPYAKEWSSAMFWVEYLAYYDTVRNVVYTDWRLPKHTDTGAPGCDYDIGGSDCGFNVDTATGELAHLFYDELGNDSTPKWPQPINMGPFYYPAEYFYWYASPYPTIDNAAWVFHFYGGFQTAMQYGEAYAWAVRDGDVAAETIAGEPPRDYRCGADGFCTLNPFPMPEPPRGTHSSGYSGAGFTNDPGVNVVPEPQTLAIFLAGLGLIGLMAGRKAA